MGTRGTATANLLLLLLVQTSYCFLPVRVGELSPTRTDYTVSGLVYLLDRTSVYIKDFNFNHDNTVPGLSLQLGGTTYGNNSIIPISQVGEGVDNSLKCVSDSPTCCRGLDNPNGGGQGDWTYPSGTTVPPPPSSAGHNFYRSRSQGEIRLNQRSSTNLIGQYCCSLPTASGVMETICANLVSDTEVNKGDARFCVGYLTNDTAAVDMPLNETTLGFTSSYSETHLQLRLPSSTQGVQQLAWVGVCVAGSVIARVKVLTSSALQLPCESKFLGDLPDVGTEGISGQVFLVNRVTYAVLGLSYADQNENDAVFLTGVGGPGNDGHQVATFNDDVTTSITTIVDQDTLLTIPKAAEGVALTYLAIWSRSRNLALSTVTFPTNTIPPLPDTVPGVPIGGFYRRLHQVGGDGYALNATQLYLQGFNYDGTGPAVSFRAIRGSHFLAVDEYIDMADERGRYGNLRAYYSEDIIINLPSGWTVYDTDMISIWCEEFKTSFGELVLPQVVSLAESNFVDIQPPAPTPEEECRPLQSEVVGNCKPLDDNLNMKWVLDQQQNAATFELCGCNLDDQYVAFGLSGRSNGILMYNSDVVWAWLDNSGVHAEELVINAYSQCNLRTNADGSVSQTGACPKNVSNVFAVSGYKRGCTTCFKFTRPILAVDSQDKSFTPGQQQWAIWSVGPVGTLATPSGTIKPIPFKHYRRPEYTDNLAIDFGRAPLDECGTSQCQCNIQRPLPPWRQESLEHNTTISVRIGQSGGKRGYAGITGVVGWGVSIYLNGILIPRTELYRGFTYTFVTETGNDPNNPARYHPFYITSSKRGGYMTLSEADQQAETIYAGRDSNGNWLGVGRFCYYGPEGPDQADDVSSFSEYKDTLTLSCDKEGQPGVFTWTPDENTPDEVYYQCATHQFLGWKLNIVKPPPELRPIELAVDKNSPLVIGNSVQLVFYPSKQPLSVECVLLNRDNQTQQIINCKRGLGGYIFNMTELSPARYAIEITLNKGEYDELVFIKGFKVFADPMTCGVFLTEGISYDSVQGLQVNFGYSGMVGMFEFVSCQLNDDPPTACDERQYSSSGATVRKTWNKLCIQTIGCIGEKKEDMTIYFNAETGDTITSVHSNCSALPNTPPGQPTVSGVVPSSSTTHTLYTTSPELVSPSTTHTLIEEPTIGGVLPSSSTTHTLYTTSGELLSPSTTHTLYTTSQELPSPSTTHTLIEEPTIGGVVPSSSTTHTPYTTSGELPSPSTTHTTKELIPTSSSKLVELDLQSSYTPTVQLSTVVAIATSTPTIQPSPIPTDHYTSSVELSPSSVVNALPSTTSVAMITRTEGVAPTGLPEVAPIGEMGSGGRCLTAVSVLTLLVWTAIPLLLTIL